MLDKNYDIQSKQLVAVDCSVFGYEDGILKLLLFHRNIEPCKGMFSLVGGWVNEDESVENAAFRVLKKLTGLTNIAMEQVGVFSKPDRDPGGRVITVGFNALINIKSQNEDLVKEFGAEWFDVADLPKLIFDHNEILNESLEKLRFKASYHLVGLDLLPEKFTITQLRQLYNSIFQREFDPGNFRKKILSLKVLKRLDKKDSSESKKGAFYYEFMDNGNISINERIVKT
ncbi:MAG: NUDIX domain-containing protein [Bacteroidota bacterium]